MLTKEQIEKTEAGRELDALIALELFGENVKKNWSWKYTTREYSTEISDAWEIVNLFLSKGNPMYLEVAVDNHGNQLRCCAFNHHYTPDYLPHQFNAESIELAICRAGLYMKLIELEESKIV